VKLAFIRWRQVLGHRGFHAICVAIVLLAIAIAFDVVGTALLAVLLIAFVAVFIKWLVSAPRRGSSDFTADD
jgi:hypothetical protein